MQNDLEVRAVFETDQVVQDAGNGRAEERAQSERRRPNAGQQPVSVYVVRKTALAVTTETGLYRRNENPDA